MCRLRDFHAGFPTAIRIEYIGINERRGFICRRSGRTREPIDAREFARCLDGQRQRFGNDPKHYLIKTNRPRTT